MRKGNRYSFRDFPGPTVTISFRVPETASILLTEAVRLAEDVENRTEALQDALVKWLMLEELARAQAAEAPPATTLEEIVGRDTT
jgi:hypothetical protein